MQCCAVLFNTLIWGAYEKGLIFERNTGGVSLAKERGPSFFVECTHQAPYVARTFCNDSNVSLFAISKAVNNYFELFKSDDGTAGATRHLFNSEQRQCGKSAAKNDDYAANS